MGSDNKPRLSAIRPKLLCFFFNVRNQFLGKARDFKKSISLALVPEILSQAN